MPRLPARPLRRVSGILNLDKPSGWTSFDVVARVRRLTGERRAGHAGTLDPLATGVLPVCLGGATRVVEFLADATKSYRAGIRLGIETDTYDREGRVVASRDIADLTCDRIATALEQFRGTIEQVPPMYSALKREGRPLYELARVGIEVERPARQVEIYRLDLKQCELPDLIIEVDCSKGTYIRSIAHDLGRALGSGAHLIDLIRTRVGPFRIEEAVTLEALAAAIDADTWQSLLFPVDYPLRDWPAVTLDPEAERRIVTGQTIRTTEPVPAGHRARAYSIDGRFLAILVAADGSWRPEKVFDAPPGRGFGGVPRLPPVAELNEVHGDTGRDPTDPAES